MQADVEVYAHLVKQCRMLRMAPNVDKARAALDVEQQLMRLMKTQGLSLPDSPAPAVRRRNRRSAATLPDSMVATTAGGAA